MMTIFYLFASVMFNAIDATGIDKGPLLNNQIQVALFFIFFVIIFTFFFLNIFVALIILTFQEQGEAEEGDCELERNQVNINLLHQQFQKLLSSNIDLHRWLLNLVFKTLLF